MSETAQIHKTTLSQILNGTKDPSLEQAHRITQYMGLNVRDTEYFILMTELARAGSVELRGVFLKQLQDRQAQHQQLSHRVTSSRALSTEERSIYYSNWMYSAVRNVTGVKEFRTPQGISKRLRMEPQVLMPILEFLVRTGLCVEQKGEIIPGPQMTHLDASSPFVSRHHGNWRIKAMERHPALRQEDEVAYTAPMTLSASDVSKVRALISDLVEKTDKIVGPSESEKLFCMCIDWFEVK